MVIFFAKTCDTTIGVGMISLFNKIVTRIKKEENVAIIRGIVISKCPMSASAVEEFKLAQSKERIYQFFLDEELAYNPTRSIYGIQFTLEKEGKEEKVDLFKKMNHRYISRVLTEEEKNDLLEKIKTYQFPISRITDPIIKYYGLLPGTIIEVINESFLEGLIAPINTVHKYII
jgi:DNA-directed RNA polymerase subunit H (RpoH/RPB5)